MVLEVSPKSLFGQHGYIREQQLIGQAVKHVNLAVTFVSPLSVGGFPIPLEKLPADYRRRKIHEHLSAARDTLKELGV